MTGGNGRSETASPPWQARAGELSTLWQTKAAERKARRLERETPWEVALPFSDPVLAVRLDIFTVIQKQKLPSPLAAYALDLLKIRHDQEATAARILETQAEMSQLLDAVWLACVVWPEFTTEENPAGDALPLIDVPNADKETLFNWAQGMVPDGVTFRRPADVGAARPDEPAIQPAPGDLVRRRPARGSVVGEADRGRDVLRGSGSRASATVDQERGSAAPRKGKRRNDVG